MRKLCYGKAFAEKSVDLDQHEWIERARRRFPGDLADLKKELSAIEAHMVYIKNGKAIWDDDAVHQARFYEEYNVWPLEEMIERQPSREPGAAYVAKTSYYIRDAAGSCLGIAIKVEQTDRTGSWKDSKDWWWAVRPDGRSYRGKALHEAAWELLESEKLDVEQRRLQRLDDEAIAELM